MRADFISSLLLTLLTNHFPLAMRLTNRYDPLTKSYVFGGNWGFRESQPADASAAPSSEVGNVKGSENHFGGSVVDW